MFGTQQQNTGGGFSFGQKPNSAAGGSGSSLFGGSSTLGQPQQQQQQQQQPGGGLFTSQSSFNLNQQAQQPQQNGPSIFNSNPSPGSSIFAQSTNSNPGLGQSTNLNNPGNNALSLISPAGVAPPQPPHATGGTLSHSQSTMGLSSYATPSKQSAPSWVVKDKQKVVPSHLNAAALRHKSSFSTPERLPPSASRHNSVVGTGIGQQESQSPPSFGSSFGTPKPTHTKRNHAIDEEDLPPTDSYYDMSTSASSKPHIPYSSGLKRSDSTFGISSKRFDQQKQSNSISTATASSDELVSSSVVVFGFPPSMASSIIKHFSRFGNILENVTGGGPTSSSKNGAPSLPVQSGQNWIKITYDNSASAQRALSENGTMIAGQFIIGCTIMNASNSKEITSAGENSMNGGAPAITEVDEEYDDLMDLDSSPPPQKQSRKQLTAVPPTESIYPDVNKTAEKTVPRTISMPVLPGGSGKRIQVQSNKSIFNSKRTVRFAPSMANVKEQPEVSKIKGKQGWLSWTTKRAQELVFGWDDL